MSDDHGCDKLVLCLAWETFLQNAWFWTDGTDLGRYHVELLLKYGGREPCERVALYWERQCRPDIAAKVKSIIHQGEKTP